jgi:hypothetical protein
MNTTVVYDMYLYLAMECVSFLNRDSIWWMVNETQGKITHDCSCAFYRLTSPPGTVTSNAWCLCLPQGSNEFLKIFVSLLSTDFQWMLHAACSPTKSASSRLLSVAFEHDASKACHFLELIKQLVSGDCLCLFSLHLTALYLRLPR